MATDTVEVERKYELPADAELPDLGAVRQDDLELDAVYYDTADLRLARSGVTLRRRTGGEDAGWHLKLPAAVDTRIELRLPLGLRKRVPAELVELVLSRTRGKRLEAVARIHTARRRLRLPGAEVVADEVTGTASGGEPQVWREAEVELAGGDSDLLEAIDRSLRDSGIRRSEPPSKVHRVLDVRTDQVPEVDEQSTAGEVLLAAVTDQVYQLVDLDPYARRDEPDAVHRMRVTARRLRSLLKSARGVWTEAESGFCGAGRAESGFCPVWQGKSHFQVRSHSGSPLPAVATSEPASMSR